MANRLQPRQDSSPKENKNKSHTVLILLGLFILLSMGTLGIVLLLIGLAIFAVVKGLKANKKNSSQPSRSPTPADRAKNAGVYHMIKSRDNDEPEVYQPRHAAPAQQPRAVSDHYRNCVGLSKEGRLEQLDVLLKAGILSREEYRERKARIEAEY